ncbi:hypothetical protein D3C80_397710 [compost metagenome]
MDRRPAFPERRVIIVFCNLEEAELVVVVRPHPLGSIDRAFFEGRIDIAAGDLLRHGPEFLEHLAGNPGNAHLYALEVVDGVDFLAEPAPHLRPGIAGRQTVNVMLGIELVHQRVAVTLVEPGIGQSRIHAERNCRPDRKCRILADEIVRAGVAHLDRSGRDCVSRLQAGHDFAGGERLDGKVAIRSRRDMLGNVVSAAIDRIERFRKRRRETPCNLGIGLSDCRCSQRSGSKRARSGDCSFLEELTTIHEYPPDHDRLPAHPPIRRTSSMR